MFIRLNNHVYRIKVEKLTSACDLSEPV